MPFRTTAVDGSGFSVPYEHGETRGSPHGSEDRTSIAAAAALPRYEEEKKEDFSGRVVSDLTGSSERFSLDTPSRMPSIPDAPARYQIHRAAAEKLRLQAGVHYDYYDLSEPFQMVKKSAKKFPLEDVLPKWVDFEGVKNPLVPAILKQLIQQKPNSIERLLEILLELKEQAVHEHSEEEIQVLELYFNRLVGEVLPKLEAMENRIEPLEAPSYIQQLITRAAEKILREISEVPSPTDASIKERYPERVEQFYTETDYALTRMAVEAMFKQEPNLLNSREFREIEREVCHQAAIETATDLVGGLLKKVDGEIDRIERRKVLNAQLLAPSLAPPPAARRRIGQGFKAVARDDLVIL